MNVAYLESKNLIKILFITLSFLFNFSSETKSIESKILIKVEDEIITNIDLENEYKYLLALNQNLKEIDVNRMRQFSRNSIVKEKIKKIEILRNIEKINLEEDYIERILKNVYQKLGMKNINEFKIYLESRKIDYDFVKHKIEIEAIWNELIFKKFSSKIKIDESKLKEKILKRKNINSYNLSEILFEVDNTVDLKSKFLEIENAIKNESFENAAILFSISDTSSVGGKLGWIRQDSLNDKIEKKISNLRIGEITDPIVIPHGFLILKLNNIKKVKLEIDTNSELKKLIKIKTNEQLNQFSRMYFNKVKKDIEINEK